MRPHDFPFEPSGIRHTARSLDRRARPASLPGESVIATGSVRIPAAVARYMRLLHGLIGALSGGRAAISLERLPEDPVLRISLGAPGDAAALRRALLVMLADRGFRTAEPQLLYRRGPGGLSLVGVGGVTHDARTGASVFEAWALGPFAADAERPESVPAAPLEAAVF